MAKMNVFTFENLTLYDELLKAHISAEDAKALKTVAIEGNTLKFYTVSEPVGATAPAFQITLPEQDVSDFVTKAELKKVSDKADENETAIGAINNETTGILAQAKTYADGKDTAIAEAKKAGTDAQTAATKAQGDVDALKAKVGTVPEDKTVVQMIEDAQTAATYNDTDVKADIKKNADAITDATDKLGALIGDDTGKSARTIANEELAAQLIPENAKDSLDTLTEIAAWIQKHPDDASAMNTAITALQNIVKGIGGEGESATVVAYVTSAIDALKIGDYAKAADLTAAVERIAANEKAIAGLGALAKKDTVAKTDLAEDVQASLGKADSALQEADVTALRETVAGHTTSISALETKVGDGFEAISEETIRGLFA